jgi:hypothetical protein
MLDRPPGQPSTAPYQPPAGQPCARCDDGVVTTPGFAVCDRCVEVAHHAIAMFPCQAIGPRELEAARREMDNA